MSEKVDLKLDWCSYEAAKYAVEHWHYSKTMPSGKSVKCGAWENGAYIGVIIFSLGTNKAINDNFGLDGMQVCELTRVALSSHISHVSRICKIAIKMLSSQSPGIRLIVSYADPFRGHNGGIYQAMNWIYVGNYNKDKRLRSYEKKGRVIPWRTMSEMLMNSIYPCNLDGAIKMGWKPLPLMNKHKYLYPLDKAMRAQIEPLRKPYPKRVSGETDNAPGSNRETGGASPTETL